jgi:hypothetical protein
MADFINHLLLSRIIIVIIAHISYALIGAKCLIGIITLFEG